MDNKYVIYILNCFFYNRYNSTTGIFTVPPGGDGYYYFSVYLIISSAEFAYFDIEINGNLLCTAFGDQGDTPLDPGSATCNAAVYAREGNAVFLLTTHFYYRLQQNLREGNVFTSACQEFSPKGVCIPAFLWADNSPGQTPAWVDTPQRQTPP